MMFPERVQCEVCPVDEEKNTFREALSFYSRVGWIHIKDVVADLLNRLFEKEGRCLFLKIS